jgi:hypothetical protein
MHMLTLVGTFPRGGGGGGGGYVTECQTFQTFQTFNFSIPILNLKYSVHRLISFPFFVNTQSGLLQIRASVELLMGVY